MRVSTAFSLRILSLCLLGGALLACSSEEQINYVYEDDAPLLPADHPYPTYQGDEVTFDVVRGGYQQPLLPVEVGNQTFHLLVDTGSNALLVFDDKIAPENTAIHYTETELKKEYSSGRREGVVASAPVRVGAFYDDNMTLMVIQSPDSRHDGSLTAKKADGVIGIRRTDGLALSEDDILLDVPLTELRPQVTAMEMDFPKEGQMSMSFNAMPLLDRAEERYLFRAKTYSLVGTREDQVGQSFSDLQVPFRVQSPQGIHKTNQLDILLDTGAVSKLKLDTRTARLLGYDTRKEVWRLEDSDEINLSLIGPYETLTLLPRFTPEEVKVTPYSSYPITFEAVLGIDRWQEYVVGFTFVDFQSGGPDGTILMMSREDLPKLRPQEELQEPIFTYAPEGLNTIADERFPSLSNDGSRVAYQSNRADGLGGWDVYVYEQGVGDLELPGLNSSAEDADPSLSGDGRYVTFHSNREGGAGGYDIYLYDLQDQQFVDLSAMNSSALERNPVISNDGSRLAFSSDRSGGAGGRDLYVYDWRSQTYLSTPGLNSSGGDYDPALSSDGRYLAYHRHAGQRGTTVYRDVVVYDLQEQQSVALPAEANELYTNEMATALNGDGSLLAYTTNANDEPMGLYDRDLRVVDLKRGLLRKLPGLNTNRDEHAAAFSGDGRWLAFHSQRPGGKGGSDIYFYDLSQQQPCCDIFTTSEQSLLPVEHTWSGLFTVEAQLGSQTLPLALDTNLSTLVLFSDRPVVADQVTDSTTPVNVWTPGGMLSGTVATLPTLKVGEHEATDVQAVLVNRVDYEAVVPSDTSGFYGVLGLRQYRWENEVDNSTLVDRPLAVLEPRVSRWELNLNALSQSGMSLGEAPVTGAYSENERFFIPVAGRVQSGVSGYSDLEISGRLSRQLDNGTMLQVNVQFVPGSAWRDRLVLDSAIAAQLGYDNTTSTFAVGGPIGIFAESLGETLYLSEALTENVEIRNLEQSNGCCYNVVVGQEYWMDFVVSLDAIDFQSGGPSAVVSLVQRHYNQLVPTYREDSRLIALPGLNSAADDAFGEITADGQTIAFQSNRNGSVDIFVYRMGSGLLTDLPGLNSASTDADPSVSDDGRYVAFHSDRDGDWNIYLYDTWESTLVDLPGLNTSYLERSAALSGDGTLLSFRSERPRANGATDSDLYLYSLVDQQLIELPNLNWESSIQISDNELAYDASLDASGELISFHSRQRQAANEGSRDVYIYSRKRERLLNLSEELNTVYTEAATSLSSDGRYLALHGNFRNPQYENRGRDILLYDLEVDEFLALPGINSQQEDSAPSVTEEAQQILFHSKRPGGKGGYDLFLYQRDGY